MPDANAEVLFNKTFNKQGGDNLEHLNGLNVSIEGNWRFLITRVQPLVTDYTYRVNAEERLLPNKSVYSAFYRGPAGTQKVVRSLDKTPVLYTRGV